MDVFGFDGLVYVLHWLYSIPLADCRRKVMFVDGVYGDLPSGSSFLLIVLLVMVLGTQLFLAGFIGDLNSRSNPRRNDYQIEKEMCEKSLFL